MTTAPFVELRFNPTDLRPRDLPRSGAFLGTPSQALEASLAVVRAAVVDQMKNEARGLANPTEAQLLRMADLAWQGAFYRFRKISAPVMADAYIRAYRAADAGDVPMHVIYDLADKHAEKVGEYFHETSRTALAQGFNTLVNRRVPARAATDRVLDAYGLTPRQMRTYVGASTFETPVSDVMPRSVKAKARAYIDRAFTTRVRKLSRQEEHNIDQQAQQFAWMWLQEKGRLNSKAMKLWITAKDERVCQVCGPLHNKRVPVNEQFKTGHGEFWTPGLHPNCRCEVRLLEMKFSKALTGHDRYEFNQLHPRAEGGRFGVKTRTKTIDVDEEFSRIVGQPTRHITYSRTAVDPQEDLKFAEIAQYSVLPAARANVRAAPAPGSARAYVSPAVADEPWSPVAAPTTQGKTQVTTGVEAKPEPQAKTPQAKPATARVVEARTKTGQLRWVVLSEEHYDPKTPGKYELNPGDVAYTSVEQADAEASKVMDRRAARTTAQIVKDGATFHDSVRGVELTLPSGERVSTGPKESRLLKLTPQQVKRAVEYKVRLDNSNRSMGHDIAGAESQEVEHVNEINAYGQVVGTHEIPLAELPSKIGIGDKDFAVDVLGVPVERGQASTAAHDELDPTAIEFQGIFRGQETGWATGQKFNARHLEVRSGRLKPKRD